MSGCLGVKRWRAFGDPCGKLGQTRMAAQGFYRVVGARQFGFSERCMYFIVADLVQEYGRTALAAAQLGYKMVQALLGVCWNGSVA